MGSPVALLVATMDTKGQEALFLEACLKEAGVSVWMMDAGISGKSPVPTDIDREEVARAAGQPLTAVQVGVQAKDEAPAYRVAAGRALRGGPVLEGRHTSGD